MTDEVPDRKIPHNYPKNWLPPSEEILTILALFGYSLGEKQKRKRKKPAKARHRWSKRSAKSLYCKLQKQPSNTILA